MQSNKVTGQRKRERQTNHKPLVRAASWNCNLTAHFAIGIVSAWLLLLSAFVLCVCVFFACDSFASHHIHVQYCIVWIRFNSNVVCMQRSQWIFCYCVALYNDIELPSFHALMHIHTPTMEQTTFKHSPTKLQWSINMIRCVWLTKNSVKAHESS